MDQPVSPSSGQEATVGAKTNSIDLREMGVLLKKKVGGAGTPGLPHMALCALSQGFSTPILGLAVLFEGLCKPEFQTYPQMIFSTMPRPLLPHAPCWVSVSSQCSTAECCVAPTTG